MQLRPHEHLRVSPRNVKRIENFDAKDVGVWPTAGINITPGDVQRMASMAMDNQQPLVTTASVSTPVQFLQAWAPGFTYVLTDARKIDELIGYSIIGSWEDEQVVHGIMEFTGSPTLYGDAADINFASWNTNFMTNTVVRFMNGMLVGILEEKRAARQEVDSGASKRIACGEGLEIQRNQIGFYGFNSGSNNTYGFLNAPGIPAYVTAANGASGSPLWSTKTTLEIEADIRQGLQTLRTQTGERVNPDDIPITLALPTAVVDYLTTATQFNISVKDWLKANYPKLRIVSAPQLDGANGGANVYYMYAEEVPDSGTDDRRTFVQDIQTKFMVLGVQKLVQGYREGYSNATAGVVCKRPGAVFTMTGI